MSEGKEADSSSTVDSESLGETTDVLNMVMVFLFMYLDINLIFGSLCIFVCLCIRILPILLYA